MHKLLETVYNAGEYDDWSSKLIQIESEKVNATLKSLATNLTQIICSQVSLQSHKERVMTQLENLLSSE